MGRAVIKTVAEAEIRPFPSLPGVSARGQVETKGVIAETGRPILLWSHRLAPGAEVRWNSPPVGHALYVWEGAAEVDGKPLAAEGALIVEHGARNLLRAGPDGAHLLHFHRPAEHPMVPTRAGGHVHVVNVDEAPVYAHYEGVMYANSGCPTCELWLHRNRMPAVNGGAPRHMHQEDEIIVVVGGAMGFGTRALPAGTALAIDAETVYGFTAGEPELVFINFRPCEPHYVPMGPQGRGEPISELQATNSMMGDPAATAALLEKVNMA